MTSFPCKTAVEKEWKMPVHRYIFARDIKTCTGMPLRRFHSLIILMYFTRLNWAKLFCFVLFVFTSSFSSQPNGWTLYHNRHSASKAGPGAGYGWRRNEGPLCWETHYHRYLPLKPGVGQRTNSRALPIARRATNSFLIPAFLSFNFTSPHPL